MSTNKPVSGESPETGATKSRPVGKLRGTIPIWQSVALGALCVLTFLGIWWILTYGEVYENRILEPTQLPSPSETFAKLPALFQVSQVDWNILLSLKRVAIGFALSIAVGVPLGIACGCFPRVAAFVAPISIAGRNVPMAALIGVMLAIFRGGELQNYMFIFIATVGFVLSDATQATRNVAVKYIDTAYTLGASRWQTIFKVLVPLALPNICDSLRLLFGLAFGYIMLVEFSGDSEDGINGVGFLLNLAQGRGGERANLYLIALLIPVVAIVIDRALFWLQREAFPHAYNSAGLLARGFKWLKSCWESATRMFADPKVEERYKAVLAEARGKSAAKEKAGQGDA